MRSIQNIQRRQFLAAERFIRRAYRPGWTL
jgi:hypothetical protein